MHAPTRWTVRLAASSAALAALCLVASAPALAQQFLAPPAAIKLIMDGREWSAKSADGKNLRITLNRDGTGSAKGPMPFALSISWEIKGEAICLNVGPGGTKCVRFRQVAGGFEGWLGDKLDLTLSR